MANIFSDKHIISDLIEHYLYNKIKLSNAECQSYKRMMGTFAGNPDCYQQVPWAFLRSTFQQSVKPMRALKMPKDSSIRNVGISK